MAVETPTPSPAAKRGVRRWKREGLRMREAIVRSFNLYVGGFVAKDVL